jgi:ubiquinone biosynthesis protein UbiJ
MEIYISHTMPPTASGTAADDESQVSVPASVIVELATAVIRTQQQTSAALADEVDHLRAENDHLRRRLAAMCRPANAVLQ